MANYDIGSLIKRLRKQRGLTQEELAYPIVDRATLSKIEGGKVTPNKNTTEALLQRLGFNPVNTIDFFLDNEMSQAHKVMEEIRVFNSLRAPEVSEKTLATATKVDDLIAQLESNEKFMQNKLNLQFILMSKYKNAIINRFQSPKEIMPMALDALKITIPEYDQQYIENYYLARQEGAILTDIALMSHLNGDNETAVAIGYAMRRNTKKNTLDISEMSKDYTTISNSLARFLTVSKKYQEALDVCNDAIETAQKTHTYSISLTNIVAIKARCLLELGDSISAEDFFRQAYYSSIMLGNIPNANNIQKTVKTLLNIDL